MRRLVTPLIAIAVAGFAIGAVYRYLWDDLGRPVLIARASDRV